VKGVKPEGILISLGLPGTMKLSEFKEIMLGIIEYNSKFHIDYIGGDLNQTKELIINPSVFGFKEHSKIIHRNGLKPGNLLVSNGKFGLTGVGFDILLSKEGSVRDFPKYTKSIMSVLEPQDLGNEAFTLAENNFATASIDSSDGLNKSLIDLMIANPSCGFEIELSDNLFEKEALEYSLEFNIPLQNLVFKGGEEFFHLFTIDEKNLSSAQKAVHKGGGKIYKIGRVLSEEKIYYLTQGKKIELNDVGFEHFK
jgi:thiamine-monophosphate kinase